MTANDIAAARRLLGEHTPPDLTSGYIQAIGLALVDIAGSLAPTKADVAPDNATVTPDLLRMDTLDWLDREIGCMQTAANSGGLTLSPESCRQFAGWFSHVRSLITRA